MPLLRSTQICLYSIRWPLLPSAATAFNYSPRLYSLYVRHGRWTHNSSQRLFDPLTVNTPHQIIDSGDYNSTSGIPGLTNTFWNVSSKGALENTDGWTKLFQGPVTPMVFLPQRRDLSGNGKCYAVGDKPGGVYRCYNPKTTVCCSDGTSYPQGSECVAGGCCPSGQKQCGVLYPYQRPLLREGGQTWGCFDINLVSIGEKFVLLLAGWDCETNLPDPESLVNLLNSTLSQRGVVTGGVAITGGTRDRAFVDRAVRYWQSPGALCRSYDPSNPDRNMVAIPLGDVVAGSHSVTLNVTGKIDNITLVDSSGGDYPATVSGDGKTVSFKLTQDTAAIGLNAVTTDDTIQVQYQAKKSSAAAIKVSYSMILFVASIMILMEWSVRW